MNLNENEFNYPQWNDPEAIKMAPYIKTFGQSRPGFKLYSDAETLLLGLGVNIEQPKPTNLVDLVATTQAQEIANPQVLSNNMQADQGEFITPAINQVLPYQPTLVKVINPDEQLDETRSSFKGWLIWGFLTLLFAIGLFLGLGFFVIEWQDPSKWMNPPAYQTNVGVLATLATIFFLYTISAQIFLTITSIKINRDHQWQKIGVKLSAWSKIAPAIPILGLIAGAWTYFLKIEPALLRQNKNQLSHQQIIINNDQSSTL